MYNFYQSEIWKHINQDIYHKPTTTVDIFGRTYQAILWQKKLGPTMLTRIQILGVTGLDEAQIAQFPKLLKPLKKKYQAFAVQIGFSDILHGANAKDLDKPATIKAFQDKHTTSDQMLKKLGFYKSHKENLPPSTYLINLTQPLETIRTNIAAQHKNKIKKAQKHDVICDIATPNEAKIFYDLLVKTGNNKGFGVISRESFQKLIQDLTTTNSGKLYIAKHENHIVGGAVYIMDQEHKTAVYLYGATDRSIGNIGIGQYIHRYIFDDLKKEGITTVDLLGGGPTGDKSHHLAAVGSFKEGFGGRKVEFIGSFDIVYNKLLYTLWQWRYSRRKNS